MDLKVQINSWFLDEEYWIPGSSIIILNVLRASYFGKIDLFDYYYQVEFEEENKEHMHNQDTSEAIELYQIHIWL